MGTLDFSSFLFSVIEYLISIVIRRGPGDEGEREKISAGVDGESRRFKRISS